MGNIKKNKLGEEGIGRLLYSLALPAIIAQIVNLLYNMVDRMYIGHIPEIGGKALTGVGVAMPITIIISAFAVLVGMGGAPRMAIAMGEKDEKTAKKILGNSISSLFIISMALTLFFLFFNKSLLQAFGASEESLKYALEYMGIYTLGTVFVQVAIGLNPFISTQGFSKVSMMTVLIGAILNIVLDPIFIFVFNMGVKGAALATIISQGVSAIWVLKFLSGDKTLIRFKKSDLKIEKDVILPILALGLSPFVMQITESITAISFNVSLQKYGGDIAVGSMTILISAMQFMFLPLSGLTQGAQPIISYNYGAKNLDRVRKTFKLLLISAFSYASLFWLFLMVRPNIFVSMFTNNKEIVELASWGLRIFMSASLLMGIQISCQQTLVALGNAKTSLFLAFLRKVILLIPLIYLLPLFFEDKIFGVFMAEPIADLIAVSVTSIFFYREIKKLFRREGKGKL